MAAGDGTLEELFLDREQVDGRVLDAGERDADRLDLPACQELVRACFERRNGRTLGCVLGQHAQHGAAVERRVRRREQACEALVAQLPGSRNRAEVGTDLGTDGCRVSKASTAA